MVFSGFLSTPSERAMKAKRLSSPSAASLSSTLGGSHDVVHSEYISDESQLRPVEVDAPDLRELNACLEALAVVFPDIQIEVFREMLANFDGESRLALVADAVLKNRISWVKGRWRVADAQKRDGNGEKTDSTAPARGASNTSQQGVVPRAEAFRSAEYKRAVRSLAWHEFKGLSKSTINAVLAESNYSYLEARRTLVDLSSKSWRFTISSLFLRRKPVTHSEAENHPLVIWHSSGRGSIVPCVKSTGSAELDKELYDELIAPLKQRTRLAQEEEDRQHALKMNTKEAEEADQLFECSCCFVDYTFEQIASCNTEGHLVCFRCIQHSIEEAVYGQGWQPLIDKETGTLRCPAVNQDCKGCIPSDLIYRAMLEDKRGACTLQRLEQRLAEHSLVSSNLPLIRCPFCNYAEVDDLYVPREEARLRFRANNIFILLAFILFVAVVPAVLIIVVVSSFLAILISTERTFGDYLKRNVSQSLLRYRRRRRGLKFVCQNVDCKRVSCLSCTKEWADIHICHESALVALRTQVEQAMSMAIKRVCPRCNTSFVKTTGCNKLTCPCGYKMCYVCRKDIGGSGEGPDVGYRHFCEHFRPEGDARPCNKCTKCNLWESENTEHVLRQAKEEAERKWLETENRELSGAEKAFLETGVTLDRRPRWVGNVFIKGRWPSMAEFCDLMVENILV